MTNQLVKQDLYSLSLWERVRARAYDGALSLFFCRRLSRLQNGIKEVCRLSPHPRPFSQGEKGEIPKTIIAQLLVMIVCAKLVTVDYSLSFWERVRVRNDGTIRLLDCRRLSRLQSGIKEVVRRLSPHPRPFSQGEKGEIPKKIIAQLVVVILCAVALKFFYSTASVNELRWILAPTTFAVELISRERFQFESYAGYINSNHTFVIAASCAGVNFLLTAFLMLALGQLWRNRRRHISWSFLPLTAFVAYVATLIANTVRITTAIQLRNLRIESTWLTAGEVHRLEGIFVYFGFLLLLWVLSERVNYERSEGRNVEPSKLVRGSVFPLMIYYGTTLGIPLLNGAFRQAEFWQHSVFVLAIPLVFIVPMGALRYARLRRAGDKRLQVAAGIESERCMPEACVPVGESILTSV